jgi:hypothetical protein
MSKSSTGLNNVVPELIPPCHCRQDRSGITPERAEKEPIGNDQCEVHNICRYHGNEQLSRVGIYKVGEMGHGRGSKWRAVFPLEICIFGVYSSDVDITFSTCTGCPMTLS